MSILTKIVSFLTKITSILTKMKFKTRFITEITINLVFLCPNLLYIEFNCSFCVLQVVLVTWLDKALPKQKLFCRALLYCNKISHVISLYFLGVSIHNSRDREYINPKFEPIFKKYDSFSVIFLSFWYFISTILAQ